MGGLTKEWFQMLIRKIFDPEYGMFVYHPNSRCYWFSVSNKKGNLREYNLIGKTTGVCLLKKSFVFMCCMFLIWIL
jgi:myo-inositol-hexaphosphate 3-phosphohydrolase